MTSSDTTWQKAFEARDDLHQFGENAIGLFALALRFGLDDIDSVATESITDGADDKKCDLVFIDREKRVAVLAQCYFSKSDKQSAPSNKASDLNTAVAWLLQRDIRDLPERLRSNAHELRSAIVSREVDRFEAWYVHNLPESANVREELRTVESTVKNLVDALAAEARITVSGKEIGRTALEALYRETLSPILVNDEISIDIDSGFTIETKDWKSFVTAIPARTLHRLYGKYKAKLFSANVRDYLGSRNSDVNINHGIKKTAQTAPEDFWVFNNGITVLTHHFEATNPKGKRQLVLSGLSIVNGAQTTGALGSLGKAPEPSALVPARVVQTSNTELIYQIIQYNNSQNKVTASDFRSTDKIQKRLRDEVDQIPNAKYEGGRRGGHVDIIARNKNLMPSYTVGQALAAFHQDPLTAYNSKSDIWVSDAKYAAIFNDDTTGGHLVLCYSLLRSVEQAKQALVVRSKGLVRDEDVTKAGDPELGRGCSGGFAVLSAAQRGIDGRAKEQRACAKGDYHVSGPGSGNGGCECRNLQEVWTTDYCGQVGSAERLCSLRFAPKERALGCPRLRPWRRQIAGGVQDGRKVASPATSNPHFMRFSRVVLISSRRSVAWRGQGGSA